ncbi:MAG: hypothetical protein AB7R55_01275 [Gemmatimonadales bacterium]
MSANLLSRIATAVADAPGLLASIALLAACGGGDSGPNPPPPPPPPPAASDRIEKANPSGDAQAGRPNTALSDPIRVVVRNGSTPVSGKTITWSPTAGSVNPTTSTTGADGIASTTVTLPGGGSMTITAAASNATGSPLSFSATVAEQNAIVEVLNNRFDPDNLAIVAGGTVTFNWPAGSLQHNLVPDDGKTVPNEAAIHNGVFSLAFQFPTAGEYFYHCSVHGATRSGMYGRILVIP